MLVSTILVVGENCTVDPGEGRQGGSASPAGMLGGNPIACLDLLGQPVLERIIERLQFDGVALATVVIRDRFCHLLRVPSSPETRIRVVGPQTDLWSAAECTLHENVQQGVDRILLVRVGPYVEFDVADLIRFHQASKQTVTAVTREGEPLDCWMIEADEVRNLRRMGLPFLINREDLAGAIPYSAKRYVGRLEVPCDLRKLAVDGLMGRCSILPRGRQVEPGIWFDTGVRAHRRARIEAPAYIGRKVRLHADTLIGAFSVLERGCNVGEGTVIEDASILANTYIGKGLNVAHAMVDGNKLLPLRDNIMVEISDESLLGRTVPTEATVTAGVVGRGSNGLSLAERLLATAWN